MEKGKKCFIMSGKYIGRKGKIESDIITKISKGKKLHVSLIDPDPKKLSPEETSRRAKQLAKWGTDIFFVGGSSNVKKEDVDNTIHAIKNVCKVPIVLYPGNPKGVSELADGILFMSLLNSKDPFWISHAQAKSAVNIRQMGIEAIPMAYLVVAPGMKVGQVGKAKLIKTPEESAGYAAAAEMMGFRLVYLEAGSGAKKPVPVELVRVARAQLKVPLIVGGGLTTPEAVKERLQAGADIIVTGTSIENDFEAMQDIIKTIKKFK